MILLKKKEIVPLIIATVMLAIIIGLCYSAVGCASIDRGGEHQSVDAPSVSVLVDAPAVVADAPMVSTPDAAVPEDAPEHVCDAAQSCTCDDQCPCDEICEKDYCVPELPGGGKCDQHGCHHR